MIVAGLLEAPQAAVAYERRDVGEGERERSPATHIVQPDEHQGSDAGGQEALGAWPRDY